MDELFTNKDGILGFLVSQRADDKLSTRELIAILGMVNIMTIFDVLERTGSSSRAELPDKSAVLKEILSQIGSGSLDASLIREVAKLVGKSPATVSTLLGSLMSKEAKSGVEDDGKRVTRKEV